jgi:hypothetical protein
MALMHLLVTPTSGEEPYDLDVLSRDVLNWERSGKGRTMAQLQRNTTMVGVYELSHWAARRAQVFSGTLTEWEEAVDVEIKTEDEADPDEDPTR